MFSQYEEERFILARTPQEGRFLDIGAWHAEQFSNTRALYLRGWSGVLVEPSPQPFAGLQAAYAGDSRVQLVNACVGFDTHPVDIWVTADAVSTTDAATYKKWRGAVQYTGRMTVPQVTLEWLYKDGSFDFVNIDAEGTSVDLFHRLMDLGHRPACVCVEYDDRLAELMQRATQSGYACVYSNGTNLVLAQ